MGVVAEQVQVKLRETVTAIGRYTQLSSQDVTKAYTVSTCELICILTSTKRLMSIVSITQKGQPSTGQFPISD